MPQDNGPGASSGPRPESRGVSIAGSDVSGSTGRDITTPATSTSRDIGEDDPIIQKRCALARKGGKLDLCKLGLKMVPPMAVDPILAEHIRVAWLYDNEIATLPLGIGRWKVLSQLRLSNNRLRQLPPEVGQLKYLGMLHVDCNRLECLPVELAKCAMLNFLDFKDNRVRRIPVHLGVLPKLKDIEFDLNPLVFPHKKVLGQGKVAVIKYLKRFAEARKTGHLNLTRVGLNEIPSEIGYVGQNLTSLDASDILPGEGMVLPFELGGCPNLTRCLLNPQLKILSPPEGTVRQGIETIVSYLSRFNDAMRIQTLDLRSMGLNSFPQELDDEKHMQPERVLRFLLSDNEIEALPHQIGNLANLEVLDASKNRLQMLPVALQKLGLLNVLNVADNALVEVPEVLAKVRTLKIFIASRNSIDKISENLVDMKELLEFDVSDNQILKLPKCMGLWINLQQLFVQSNYLTEFPFELCNLSSLEKINIGHNKIRRLPREIGRLHSLTELILDNTSVYELPAEIGKLSMLTRLNCLACERLTAVPYHIADISRFRCPLVFGEPYLKELLLDAAFVRSPPPEAIAAGVGSMYEFLNLMRVSDMSSAFTYSSKGIVDIPNGIYQFSGLKTLTLSNNKIAELSEDMSRLKTLEIMRLDDNLLTTLPAAVSAMDSLTLLSIQHNKLETLPMELGMLTRLRTLDLGFPGPDMKMPPKEVSRKGGAAVLDYLRRMVATLRHGRLEAQRLALVAIPDEFEMLRNSMWRLSLAHNRIAELGDVVSLCDKLKVLRLHDNALAQLPQSMSLLTGLRDLDLEGNRLAVCPTVLSDLTALTLLRLGRNELYECPVHVCKLTLLQELFLDHNCMSVLPNRIGMCAKLVHLSVSHNELTRLPAGMKELISLTILNVSHNKLVMIPPEVGLLPSLEVGDFAANPIASPPGGVIKLGTMAVAHFLSKIQLMKDTGVVDLDSSNLDTIPLDVLSYDAVHTIIMTRNMLECLPESIGGLRHLTSLDLSFNRITSLPSSLGDCFSLQELYLIKNELSSLPWQIGRLTNLRVLDLDIERITCPPTSVSTRGGKEIQRFFQNLLTGQSNLHMDLTEFDLVAVPDEVLDMHSLLELILASNNLQALPPSIVELTQLQALNLDQNAGIRDLPKTMRKMTSICVFSMAGNNLRNIPDEIFRLSNLTSLNLSNNKMEGIGNLLCNLSQLTHLDLSHNGLWNLPWPAMMQLIHLERLELQGNPITLLPSSVADLTHLTYLDLGDSELKMLPADMVDMMELSFLNLENVDLQGPSTLTVADGLEAILAFLRLMRECRVTCTLELINYSCEGGRKMGFEPYTLCTALTSLTLTESGLEFVPSAVLDLSNLTLLDLCNNKLQHLPDSCGIQLGHLETLLIRNNQIKSLPGGIGGLTCLKTLAASSNALETLPPTIGKCTSLTELDLRDNQISFLPKEVLACKNVTNLDMEFRYLTVLRSLNMPWSSWGNPAPDIILQGPKMVRRYYKELMRAAGQGGDLGSMLGKSSYLDLHGYGLLTVPEAVMQSKLLSHLTSLNLSGNHLQFLSQSISKLAGLNHLDLSGCPLKRLPPALGALDNVELKANVSELRNIPDVWLSRGEAGVMDYLRKANIEIQVGVLDLSSVRLSQMPPDLSDLVSVRVLSLERNRIAFVPASIEMLSNLTNLALNDNRLCCLPRQLGDVASLTSLSLQGNRISILPTELGRLSNLQELVFDAATLEPIPSEVQYMGVDAIIRFLLKLETSRGLRRSVSPMPGLKWGESFDANLDGQVYTLSIPRGSKGRDKFTAYLPRIARDVRSNMVLAGYKFMTRTAVGHVLDLSDCNLTKWRLVAIKGTMLDNAQDDLYLRGTLTTSPQEQSARTEVLVSGDDSESVMSSDTGSVASASSSSVFSSVFGTTTKAKMKEPDTYQVDAEGILQNLTAEVEAKEAAERAGANKSLELLKSLAGLKKAKADGPVRDLPLLRFESDDLIASWMVDNTLNSSFPLPICVATNLTVLNLDKNKLTSISSSVGTMSHLVTLSAQFNRIESISWRLRYLVHLKEIHLKHNRLTHLPPKIGRCEKLEILDVSKNKLVQLPVSIGRLSVLHTLNISHNPLEYLPHEIGGVDNLEFNDVVGLVRLRSLLASQCSKLRYLPSKLFRLTALESLELVGADALVNPPWEVIDQGFDAVFAFLKRLYDCENSDSFNLSRVGLYWPPLCLAEIEKKLNEKQGDYQGMPFLHHLDLSHNHIKELPSYMKVLTNLRSLNLDYNRLQVLPSFFSLLTRLGVLSVNHNKIKGFCPEMNNLLSIRSIIANNNMLDHIFDGIGRLSTLLELSVNNNDIGLISDVVLGLSDLKYLRLGGNRIRKIPKTIPKMIALEQLVLYDNKLDQVPDEMGEMLSLRELDVADNRIEMLPLGLGKLSNLTKLEVRRNGCIRPPKGTQNKGPREVVEYLRRIERAHHHRLLEVANFGLEAFPIDALKLDDMTELNMSHNRITSVPHEILGLTRLICLRMAHNSINQLPHIVCKISTLQSLDLHGNLLFSLPPIFAEMTRLISLILSTNKFEIFPPPVENMTQLQMLDFTGNGLTRLPYFIGRLVCAHAILLGGNNLAVMPDSIGALGKVVLSTLNLSHNGLTRVPGALCNVLTIETLCLSGNDLKELPSQLGRLANLTELWIDNNRIKLMPPTIGGWVKMQRLIMHNNQLKMLPKQLPDLTQIELLTLSGNRLTNLPWDLWKLTKLQELWLDGNELERLPEGIEKMPSLKSVSCKFNPFSNDEAERAQRIMGMFPDTDGAMRLKQAELDAAKKLEREAVAQATLIESDEDEAKTRSAEEEMRDEVELLNRQLAEALASKDYDGADRMQARIDVLTDNLTRGVTDGFGRVPSVFEDSSTFSISVQVISCSGLVSCTKKADIVSPYVVLEMPRSRETKFKSRVVKKSNDPLFGETFSFEGVKGKDCELLVTVYHKNFISSDSQVGRVKVPRQDVYGGAHEEKRFPLTSHTGVTAGKQVGSIALKFDSI